MVAALAPRTEATLVPLLLALALFPAHAGDPPIRGATEVRLHAPPHTALPPAHDPLEWVPAPTVLRGDQPGALELVLDVPPGFVVYRDQLHVEVVDRADLHVGPPDIPPGVVRLTPGRDETPREQYDTDVVVRIPARAALPRPGVRTVHVRVRHQGCFGGHCFRPQQQIVPVHVPVRPHDPEPRAPARRDAEGNLTDPDDAPDASTTEPAHALLPADGVHHPVPAPGFVVYVYPR